jgi:hypothetical protein
MKTIDNEQIERVLEDIASIKEVINFDYSIIRQVFAFAHFRRLSLLVGISIIGFSMLFYFLMGYYGNYGAIPVKLKWSIYIAIAIDAVILQIMKIRLFSGLLKKSDQNLTLSRSFKSFFKKSPSDPSKHFFSSTIFLFYFLIVFFIIRGIPYYIIPACSIFCGLVGFFMVILGLKHYLIWGYWSFVTGICLLIFNTIPAPIAVSITLGVGGLISAVFGYMDQKSGKEK